MNALHLGAILKYQPVSSVMLAGSLSWSSLDSRANRGVSGSGRQARSQRDGRIFSALLSASLTAGGTAGYVRPSLDLGFHRVDIDGSNEFGDSALRLRLPASRQRYWWLRPRVETGFERALGEDTTMRLRAGLDWRYYAGRDEYRAAAGLIQAPAGTASMIPAVDIGHQGLGADVGMSLHWRSGASLNLEASWQDSDAWSGEQLRLRLELPL